MKQLIQDFTDQLREANAIGSSYTFIHNYSDFQNITVCGLGGSGFGANLIYDLCQAEMSVPFNVSKGYTIPGYINEKSLVIVSSYSGNTEETLESMALAEAAGAQIIGITSGGKVKAHCEAKGYDVITVPGGKPPRACLGYSFVQQLYILKHVGQISASKLDELQSSMVLLDEEQASIDEYTKSLAEKLYTKIPILYSEDSMESVAIRFRQQINENGKMLCWHHVIPEMNHNELVGWRQKKEDWAVILLRKDSDYSRNQVRMEINKTIIAEYCDSITEIHAKGDNDMERALYLIHVADWLSWHLSVYREVDATEVKVIDFLKGELAKQ